MNEQIILQKPTGKIQCNIRLSSSKSESNRALIINEVSGNRCTLHNLSDARDTQTMKRLLQSADTVLDVLDAGTTMRFLIALKALKGEHKILTGTPRMCERPVKILVDALRQLGAVIEYEQQDGYPPVALKGFDAVTNRIQVQGDISSQYISALLMVSPLLPDGLHIELLGNVASKPYIEMTLDLMRHFGVKHTWEGSTIHVPKQSYTANEYTIESDWSGASYWFSLVALSDNAEVELLGLKQNSLQGDSAIVAIMEQIGVHAEYTEQGVKLTKTGSKTGTPINFSDCPDLAQTVVACAAALGIPLRLNGIESLRIKETDRIAALQNELQKMGGDLVEKENGYFEVKPIVRKEKTTLIHCYDDHRMAMAFAPLALVTGIAIDEPHVVKKSYPGFWEDLKKAGFGIL